MRSVIILEQNELVPVRQNELVPVRQVRGRRESVEGREQGAGESRDADEEGGGEKGGGVGGAECVL